jgi:hypothetical protein
MKTAVFFIACVLCFAGGNRSNAQDAAPPAVDFHPPPTLPPEEHVAPARVPSPDVPELSRLDEAFRHTSIGKAADEVRERVEIRKLQNRVSQEEEVVAAKQVAESSTTDLEKRERLRSYYDLYYGKMRRLASDDNTRKALDDLKESHVKLLDQPRVRPVPGSSPPRVPPEEKKPKTKKSRFGRTTAE